MFKTLKEIEKFEKEKLLEEIKNKTIVLSQMIEFLKDYGNMTKRKNNKLKYSDFVKCQNSILSMPLMLCVSNKIIASSKKMHNKYNKLLLEIQSMIEKAIKEKRSAENASNNKQHDSGNTVNNDINSNSNI